MTKFSRFLLNKFNFTQIISTRRQNFKFLLEKLTQSKQLVPLYKNISDKICPLGFPVLTEKREFLKSKLITNNIFPPIHWDLSGHIEKEKFSESWELSKQILTIPCDQRYSKNDMQHIVDVINN
jgi:dTDP-4-amino-4,6-dideoxygalactose transaminase